MEIQTLLYKEAKLSYRIAGEGPVVVLLHGFGEDGSIWKRQYPAFAGYQLIVPDLPGSGASEMIKDMSLEGLADAVHTILLAENVDSCVLIGHSMGGYITLALAEKFGEMLGGFGLFHSTAYADSDEKRSTRQKGIEFIEKNGAASFLKTSTPNLYSAGSKKEHPEWIEEQLRSVEEVSDAALVAYYRSMMKRPDRTGLLKEAKVPVLFVLGREDSAVPLADGLQQCHLPRLSQVHILEKCGHMGMVEEQEKATAILTTFVTCSTKPLN